MEDAPRSSKRWPEFVRWSVSARRGPQINHMWQVLLVVSLLVTAWRGLSAARSFSA